MLENHTLFVDIYGYLVERTPVEHPYNFDPYVLWKSLEFDSSDKVCWSDRLYQYDSALFDRCCKKIWNNTSQNFHNRRHQDVELFLNAYIVDDYSDKIKLTAVEECCNFSTGYPYWAFHYKEVS